MKKLIIILTMFTALTSKGQVISKFTWSSTPLTTAAQGPNGTSISASATSSNVGGAVGWALNPGLPTANVDLVVPGSPYFDVNNIDISLYFRREESVASFFKRGANFEFASNGGFLTVKFTTTRGSTPGDTTINSGNIVAIADDHAFHNYRFRYDNNTGTATVLVDGSVVYTYNGVAGRPLSWTGAGNVIIGENMDATSRNVPVLGTMTVQLFNLSLLPMDVVAFNAVEKSNGAQISWKVSDETSIARYIVEKSSDNANFSAISSIDASAKGTYTMNDKSPANGVNYYRLKIVDRQGAQTYSDIKQVRFAGTTTRAVCYPNPATSYVMVNVGGEAGEVEYSLVSLQGVVVKSGVTGGNNEVRVELGGLTPGNYVVKLRNVKSGVTSSAVIVKK